MSLPALPKAGAPVSAADVLRLEQEVALRVRNIEDVELLQEWRAQAAALEAYLRGRELQRPMLGAQRRVEARIGQLLGQPKRGKVLDRGQELDERYRHEFRLLARAFEGDCQLTDEEWRKSRRALVATVRQRLGLIPETPPLPPGEYRCIVADPPWQLDTGPNVFGGTGESGHDELEYTQMSVDEIAALNVPAADDAHLYLWATNKYVERSYEVARAWGFKPSVLLVWAKTPRGVGLGDAFKLTTEFCLYARRGSLKEMRTIETTWFNWPRGRHSEKPSEFYDLVESITPANSASETLRKRRPHIRPPFTFLGWLKASGDCIRRSAHRWRSGPFHNRPAEAATRAFSTFV